MDTEEQTAVEEEEVSKEEQPSEELNNVSEKEDSGGEETEEEVKPELKYTDDSLQYHIKEAERKWQSSKDKEFQPLYQELEELKKAKLELEGKMDERANEVLFASESNDVGEEKAMTTKDARARIIARHKELKPLEDLNRKLPSVIADLEKREKTVQARDFGYQYFPESDTVSTKRRDDFIKELIESDSQSPSDMTLLARARSSEMKAVPSKKHKPDSGKQAGGGVDTTKLSGDEKVLLGLKNLRK